MFNYKFMPMLEANDDGGTVGADGNDSGAKEPNAKEPKTQTFEEMLKSNPAFQSALDRRINDAVKSATDKERDRQKIVQDNLQDEVLRVSKMTEQEKEAYFKAKADKEAKKRDAELTRRELTLDARAKLAERHLPADFVNLLNYSGREECEQSIDVLGAAFDAAVAAEVDKRLQGQAPPKDAKTEGDGADASQIEHDKVLAQARSIARLRTK